MTRLRALVLAVALGGALAAPRAASAGPPRDPAAHLAPADQRKQSAGMTNLMWSASPPLRALLARFIRLAPQRPAPEPALDDEFEAEEIDRARASRRAERDRTVADASAGAARGARRASAPSSP